MSRAPSPDELLAYVAHLSANAAIGGLGARANIPGAAELVENSAQALADIALEMGLPLADAAAIAADATLPTTGAIGQAVSELLSGARAAIVKNGRQLVNAATKAQGLVLTLGALYIAHDWATADKQLAMNRDDNAAEWITANWNNLKPEERAALTRSYLAGGDTTPSLGTILAVGAAGVLGLWAAGRFLSPPARA